MPSVTDDSLGIPPSGVMAQSKDDAELAAIYIRL